MKKNKYILLFTGITSLLSCEKDITVTLPKPEPKIVVEGHIEPGIPAYVILTHSSAYFAPVDSQTVANTVVYGATVIVSDGITADTLKQVFDFNFFPPFVYEGDPLKLKGQIGKTYSLTINAEGKTLYATTTMTPAVVLDSVWFKPENPGDSLGLAWGHLTEPAGKGNQYRWMAKRIGKDNRFIAPFASSFDDEFFDGKSFDFSALRGKEFNSSKPDDNNREALFFKKGDKIIVKFCTTDEASLKFYRGFETDAVSNGNPFAAPTTIKSNITGGLGIWGAYTPSYDTIFAK